MHPGEYWKNYRPAARIIEKCVDKFTILEYIGISSYTIPRTTQVTIIR